MYNIYLGCKQHTYEIKEEIKQLKPSSKNFKRWWIYDKYLQCWHLPVANHFFTEYFQQRLERFAKLHDLNLEILQEKKRPGKSINDFDSEEAYMDYFHTKNQPTGYIPKPKKGN